MDQLRRVYLARIAMSTAITHSATLLGDRAPLCDPPRVASAPRQKAPVGATDCHFHMLGPPDKYKLSPARGYTSPPEVNIENYLAMADTLGLQRMVIVQPAAYGTDHACTLDSIEILGRHRAKAISAIDESFSQEALRDMDRRGVCGARINAVTINGIGLNQLQPVARLIAPFGWHIQIFVDGSTLPELMPTLLSLPVPIVIDHMGRIPADRGINHPEFQALLHLLDSGKCWVKLCGYRNSSAGPPYADLLTAAQKIIQAAPGKMCLGHRLATYEYVWATFTG